MTTTTDTQQEEPMSNITVWTAPNCGDCASTVNFFKRAGFPPTVKDLSAPENLDKLKELKAQGLTRAPRVETPTDSWSGLRPDKILTAIAAEREASPAASMADPSHTHDVSA